jgi:hypothetical protein
MATGQTNWTTSHAFLCYVKLSHQALMFLLIKPIHEMATVLELSLMIAEMHKSS